MTDHFGDRLTRAMREKEAPVCVGLDPLVERLPPALLKEQHIDPDASPETLASIAPGVGAKLLRTFGRGVIEAVAPHAAVVKINIAFFERYHAHGLRAYLELTRSAREAGLMVIGDAKRADIGHTSTQYAIASLRRLSYSGRDALATPDAVTVNPYFGLDGVEPFIRIAQEEGRGVFVLVQTSNASASEIQGLELKDGDTVCHRVAKVVQGWAGADGLIGEEGYSCVGAVVSPRDLESTVRVRALMPNCIFLVPGFGAQGRTADEVAKCFKPNGTGAMVNASRSVIYAHQNEPDKDRAGDWQACVERACVEFIAAVRAASK